jgi:hypothetical protein
MIGNPLPDPAHITYPGGRESRPRLEVLWWEAVLHRARAMAELRRAAAEAGLPDADMPAPNREPDRDLPNLGQAPPKTTSKRRNCQPLPGQATFARECPDGQRAALNHDGRSG